MRVGDLDPSVTESVAVGRVLATVGSTTTPIPVTAVQLAGWRSLLGELSSVAPRLLRSLDVETLCAKHFSPLDDVPAPAPSDVAMVLAHARRLGAPPEIEPTEGVQSPFALALAIRDADLGELARSALLRTAYGGPARHLYRSVDELRHSVDAVLTRLMAAREAT
jgi:hypothetical protein